MLGSLSGEKPRGVGWLLIGGLLAAIWGCSPNIEPSKNHMLRATQPPAVVPPLPMAKEPGSGIGPLTSTGREELFTMTVTDTPVRDLLFALARDANMNVDIYPGINGRVTLSAVDQTLGQILDRIAKQVNLRYEIKEQTIVISPDRPYLKLYQVDYVNVDRKEVGNIRVATQISTEHNDPANPLTGKSDRNQSDTWINNTSNNTFWTTLNSNIQSILAQTEGIPTNYQPESSVSEAISSVDLRKGGANLEKNLKELGSHSLGDSGAMTPMTPGIVSSIPEAGIITVFAWAKQHERIQMFLDRILENVHRQVMIESTIVEVELNESHQDGVNWNTALARKVDPLGGALASTGSHLTSKFNSKTILGSTGIPVNTPTQTLKDQAIPFFATPLFQSGVSRGYPAAVETVVGATVHALQEFGTVKVLSSPKIMALNNQPAILKVVKNEVFFTVEGNQITSNTNANSTTNTIYNSRIHTVPVGLVMTVIPQVGENDVITLTVRPTISSISGYERDPNPSLRKNQGTTGLYEDITSRIPVIQLKEMETMLRIHSGQVAVMGGLMTDKVQKGNAGLPILGDLPVLGFLFNFRDESVKKTELVVFLRPVVMTNGKPKAQAIAGTLPGMAARRNPAASALNQFSAATNSYLDFTQPPGSGAAMALPPPAPPGSKTVTTESTRAGRGAAPEPGLTTLFLEGGAKSGQATTGLPLSGPLLMREDGTSKNGVYVTIGSYVEKKKADQVYSRAIRTGLPITRDHADSNGKSLQRLRAGPFRDLGEAEQARIKLDAGTGLRTTIANN